jgi:hypothetical protein
MTRRPVAVLGAYGGVGSAAVHQLHAWGAGPLRLGGRDIRCARRLLATTGAAGEAVAVDAADPASLAGFCAAARLVVNCAGPSSVLEERVAVAALEAGADYVDAGGDEPLHGALERLGLPPAGRCALVSAGMQPGLSALLVRALAADCPDATSLVAYAGGSGRFTPAAAADYLATVDTAGTPLACWRGGARAPAALPPLRDVELAFFDGRVTAYPYLSLELERVARAVGLTDATWYSVFGGEHVLRVLERGAGSAEPEVAAQALSRAAELDAFGRRSYQLFVVTLANGDGAGRTLLVRGSDPIALTGACVAVAADAVLAGDVAAGLAFAGERLDPAAALARLAGASAVDAIERVAAATPGSELVEEGVL